MNIFGEAYNKIRQTETEADKSDSDKQTAKAEVAENHVSEKVLVNKLRQDKASIQIDIPLNQDFPGLQGIDNISKYKKDQIDFDFSNLFDDNSKYPETEILSINPVKAFSRQVELDLDEMVKKGYITPHTVNTLLGNTFRMIKRPLLNNVIGKGATVVDNANLIMITSSIAGEGKTYSAINLAMSMAMEKDKHVLLIDADINKPSHHEIFGIEAEFGLTDLLLGNVKDMSKVLYRTNVSSLSLMTAGNRIAHATELLASAAMEKFAKEISSFYKDRVIIFDSPPLLLPTEASVLASHMGQVVVVVQAEVTRRQEVEKSLSLLTNKIVLLLLNQTQEASKLGNYGYYKYEDQT